MSAERVDSLAASVTSRAEFISFVEALRDDFLKRGSSWENDTLESFLDGLSGFASGLPGYYRNMGEDTDPERMTWSMAAQILLAATVYE